MRISLVMSVVLGVSAGPSQAAVYRCVTQGGQVSYQQIPCDASSEPLVLREQRYGGTALRAGEKALLKGYAQSAAGERRSRDGGLEKPAGPDRGCWRKREQLASVREELRRGYRVGKGDALRRKRDSYQEYLRLFCASR